jgi:hypothetical protein
MLMLTAQVLCGWDIAADPPAPLPAACGIEG